MANGVQISTWPRITVNADSDSPIRSSTTSSDTATMMSGSTSGSMMKPSTGPLPGNRYLVPARAAKMPEAVAKIAVITRDLQRLQQRAVQLPGRRSARRTTWW